MSSDAPQHIKPNQTNTMAIVGLVLAFTFPAAGIVVSIIALSQIAKTGEDGRGLALAGLVISIVSVVMFILFLAIWLFFILAAASAA